jgi:hypothetical protein
VKAALRITLLLFTSLLPWQAVYGQAAFPEPNWGRALAVETAHSIDTDSVLKTLYQSARAGDNRQVLDTLLTAEQNSNWPVPAREYTIWSFAIGLSDMGVNTVSPEVLEYLSAYQPRTLVAHDDRDNVGVPLFNISAAATGVRNAWARRQGRDKAEILLRNDPALWINAYLGAEPTARRGFTDALDFASDEQLESLARSAIERLDGRPSLTAVAGKSALILGDRNLLQHTLDLGSGPDLHHILKAASKSLNANENRALLFHVIRHGPNTKAGLAIAQLAPSLLDDLAVREKMFEILESRDLGSSAALVLGSSTEPAIHARLNTIAAGKEGLASQRASLAIDAGHQGREAGR